MTICCRLLKYVSTIKYTQAVYLQFGGDSVISYLGSETWYLRFIVRNSIVGIFHVLNVDSAQTGFSSVYFRSHTMIGFCRRRMT